MINKFVCRFLFLLVMTIALGNLSVAQDADSNWGQWRGPLGTGESPTATPPSRWSEAKNVRWKTKLPGLGHSSPVVWGQTVVVTSAVPFGDKFDPIPDSAPGTHDNLAVSQQFKFVVLAIDQPGHGYSDPPAFAGGFGVPSRWRTCVRLRSSTSTRWSSPATRWGAGQS